MNKIIIDKREKRSFIYKELEKEGIDFEFKTLLVADYLIKNIAIERKTAKDFINSMINKRLQKQLEELSQYEKRILLIEGDLKEIDFNQKAIRSMLLSIILDYNTPIIYTQDQEETSEFLISLLNKNNEKQEIGLKIKKKAHSLSEQQQLIVEGLPSVGPTLAKKLLKKFKTIKKLSDSSEKELLEIDKIGKKKAQIIKRILEIKYDPENN